MNEIKNLFFWLTDKILNNWQKLFQTNLSIISNKFREQKLIY